MKLACELCQELASKGTQPGRCNYPLPTCMRKILTCTVAEALLAVPIVILNDHRISEKVTKFIKSFKRTVYVQACRIEWGTPFARLPRIL